MKQGTFHAFDAVPVSDSCWSLSTGPDGRIYAAVCTEMVGGVGAYIARYDEEKDGVEYLVDVAEAVGQPPDSGLPTQCKIHYSFAPSPRTGLLYAATHLSGPAKGKLWCMPLNEWGDPSRAFPGAMLLAYDTRTDRVAWTRMMIPHEGCRCMCLDEERGLLYALSYPRDHFVVYHLDTGELCDMGRLGSVNAQAIFLDRHGRAYTTNEFGRLIRYDPERKSLEALDVYLPHANNQRPWHTVLYDAAASPDGRHIYGVSWQTDPHLFRYEPENGPQGRMEDLGPVMQNRDRTIPVSLFIDHSGGLVFGRDGALYYGVNRWREGSHPPEFDVGQGRDIAGAKGTIMRMDVESGLAEPFAELTRPGHTPLYISRGACDRNGDLFFGDVGESPAGFSRVPMNDSSQPCSPPSLRMWG